jgi:hypothetical protein
VVTPNEAQAKRDLVVNIMAVGEPEDIYYRPRVFSRPPKGRHAQRFINASLAVYGTYSGYHLTHWLFNGGLPLFGCFLLLHFL